MLRAPQPGAGARLRELWSAPPVVMPGVFNGFSARVAEECGAQALYLSGAGLTNAHLGVPDIALAGLSEFAGVSAAVCAVTERPVLADADTGFGEAANVYRAVIELERAGLAGIHLEDQVSPKRCGHLDGKALIEASAMTEKLRAALEARRDPSFVMVARTDARGVEGLAAAIERGRAYAESGADAIFPEGLTSAEEFRAFRSEVPGPLLANMTEFGKTPLISASEFGEMGYAMVIFPMTAFRAMQRALERTYRALVELGSQAGEMEHLGTRARLYELLEYGRYDAIGQEKGR